MVIYQSNQHDTSSHCLVMISIWPLLGPDSDLAREMNDGGYLFNQITWSGGKIYDAYSPEARAIYWRYARDGLFRHGIDAWWMDATEPGGNGCSDTQLSFKENLMCEPNTAAGPWRKVLMLMS